VIRILLADDQALLRMGFRLILEAEPDIEVTGEASDGAEAITMTAALRPDVVLMDVRMPGMNGIEATTRIIAAHADAKVLILTTYDLDEYTLAGLKAGASGFLLKDAPPTELLAAIRTIAAGEAALAPTATRRLIRQFLPLIPDPDQENDKQDLLAQLTERERTVFALITAGHTNGEIAAELHLSEGTVKIHVGRILAKLGLRDRVQAVILAYETGLITPGN
jgi:DNA-binding NarL/FixJ family response regulator